MPQQDVATILKKVRRIQIVANRTVNDLFAGQYKSVFRGRGMEFDEVREYQPGDDVRTIDWNVTARTGTPFIKRFCEERELTILFAVDASASGAFGSGERSKLEHGGGSGGHDDVLRPEEQRQGRAGHLLRHGAGLLSAAQRQEPRVAPHPRIDQHRTGGPADEPCGGAGVPHPRAESPRRGVPAQRFPGPRDTAVARPLQFAARSDRGQRGRSPRAGPARRGLHFAGRCRNGRRVVELDTRHPKVRELFAGRAARRAEKLSAELRKVGVDELAIRTDEDYLKGFRRFFHMRERRFR